MGTIDFGAVLGGFGEGLGSPKLSIFLFFRCFFEAFFEQRFGKQKNREKSPNIGPLTDFWVGEAECAACWGGNWEGGEGLRCRRYWQKAGDSQDQALMQKLKFWSSTLCPPSVGGGTLRAFRRPPLHAQGLGKLDDQEKN